MLFAYTIGGEPIGGRAAGEVIVFTKGDPHVMSSGPGMRGDPFAPSVIDAATSSQLPFLIDFGSTGPATKLLSAASLACDAHTFQSASRKSASSDQGRRPTEQEVRDRLGQFIRFVMMKSARSVLAVKASLARN